MNRKFPLATVLRVRRIEEDLARGAVAAKRAQAAAAEAVVAARTAALDAAVLPATAPAQVLVATLQGLAVRARDLAAAQGAVVAADAEVGNAVDVWSGARTRVRGLERLEERHVTAVREADEHAEGVERDDRAGASHHRRTSEGAVA